MFIRINNMLVNLDNVLSISKEDHKDIHDIKKMHYTIEFCVLDCRPSIYIPHMTFTDAENRNLTFESIYQTLKKKGLEV